MKSDRILIVGTSAAGKSHFSRALAQALGREVTHVDGIMWQPGWQYIGDKQTADKLNEIARSPSWIVEGYIVAEARDTLFDRADVIVHLDYNPLVSAWRYIKRSWSHRDEPRPELPGNPEVFSTRFLARIFMKEETKELSPYLESAQRMGKLVTLRSPKQARAFVKDFV